MPIVICLDEIMEIKGVSVSELARKVGISRVNMSNLKFGHVKAIRFSTLDRICDVLECQPGDLLKFEKDKSITSLLLDDADGADETCLAAPESPSSLPDATAAPLPVFVGRKTAKEGQRLRSG